jgi:hypothetical protein
MSGFYVVAAWLLLSVPLSFLVGRVIGWGTSGHRSGL